MFSEEDTFTRELDLDCLNKSLVFKQKIVGDVNCVVWDAAIVLSKYFEELYLKNENAFRKIKVLELGAGLGCVGLTLAALGADVILTDLPQTLSLLEQNIKENKTIIEENGGSAKEKVLFWGTEAGIEIVPDLITFADCVYYEESINPLISTLRDFCGSNTDIIMSQELRETSNQRKNWKKFIDTIQKEFVVDYVPLSEQNPVYSSEDIKIIKLRKRICEIS